MLYSFLYGFAQLSQHNHLNLLTITAMMRRTSTVMIAMVIIRFVAILMVEAQVVSIT